MLKNSKIVMLDEATSSVDVKTDDFIQKTIRKMENCSILTIAHRLDTIADYDRILVLSEGQMVEFDTPSNLLANSNSAYSKLKESMTSY